MSKKQYLKTDASTWPVQQDVEEGLPSSMSISSQIEMQLVNNILGRHGE